MVLVSKEEFIGTYKHKKYGRDSWEKFEKSGIIPLNPSPLLANLVGHLIGDGSISGKVDIGCLRFYGTKEKLDGIEKDMLKLFNTKIPYLIEKTKDSFELRYNNAPLHRLFSLLEVPSGDKPIKIFGVPRWIRNGDKEVKRAFLQAICDDELSTPRRIKGRKNSWDCLKLKFSKSEKLLDNGIIFLTQIKNMFKEFHILSGEVGVTGEYLRKDGVRTKGIYFNISSKVENRIKFYYEINFARESTKKSLIYESVKFNL